MALVLLAFGSACAGSAHADAAASKPILSVERSPYSIELIGESGVPLDTYRHRGRFYVQGDAGERYSIRVSNPTDQRIEAVISVDGLDVVDGETANFTSKRGYIIPAYGNVDIDGFRVSTAQVAAFRFSSVAASYAARKGKARNVGVVGVAIFAETPQALLVSPRPPVYPIRDYRKYKSSSDGHARSPSSADDSASPSESQGSSRAAPARSSVRPSGAYAAKDADKRERAGLGTEFGERRSSAVQFTTFTRANSKKPTAIAELRYNDATGLRALGIRLSDTPRFPDQGELILRETASSFPDSRFAQPPR